MNIFCLYLTKRILKYVLFQQQVEMMKATEEDFIYPILDWRNAPGTAVLWIMLFIVTIFLSQAFLSVLSFVRGKAFENWRGKFRHDIEMENLA